MRTPSAYLAVESMLGRVRSIDIPRGQLAWRGILPTESRRYSLGLRPRKGNKYQRKQRYRRKSASCRDLHIYAWL